MKTKDKLPFDDSVIKCLDEASPSCTPAPPVPDPIFQDSLSLGNELDLYPNVKLRLGGKQR